VSLVIRGAHLRLLLLGTRSDFRCECCICWQDNASADRISRPVQRLNYASS